jgi:hypothetical protein
MRRFNYYRSPAFEASHVLLFQQVFVACVSDEHFFCLFAIAWTCWWDGGIDTMIGGWIATQNNVGRNVLLNATAALHQ